MEDNPPASHQQLPPPQTLETLLYQLPPEPRQAPQLPPHIQYFIPPPINTLYSQYYQELKGIQNPRQTFAHMFTIFGQPLPRHNTELLQDNEIPITASVKSDLKRRNRKLFKTMEKILLRQGTFGGEQQLPELQTDLNTQLQEFLLICQKSHKAQIRSLRLKQLQQETVKINLRTQQIKKQLEQIKQQIKEVGQERQEEGQQGRQ